MPRLSGVTPEQLRAEREAAAARFPGSRYGEIHDLAPDVDEAFETSLSEGREEAIQRCLTDHPYLIQYAIKSSGHHGIWVYPKQAIRLRGGDGSPGLIPDFLVITRSSLGYFWQVVELKRSDAQFANANGTGLTRDAHEALVQCSRYLSHMADHIETVPRNIGIRDTLRPSNPVLIMGDAKTETEAQRCVRSDMARASNVEIVSYDRIRRHLRSDLRVMLGIATPG